MAVADMGDEKPLFEADYIALESSSGSEADLFCGVPDSEECASPGFLRALAAEMRDQRNQAGVAPPAPPAPPAQVVVVDTSGFDCRIGERPRGGVGVGCAHLNRLVKNRRSPGQASGAGDKRKRKAQGQPDGRPSKLKPGPGAPLVRLGGGSGMPQPGDSVLPGNRYPAPWPPGWEIRVQRRGPNKQPSNHFYSPSGIHFNSFAKLQQRCADLGLPSVPPQGAGAPEPRERFEESPRGLRRWLACAATLGRLPPSRLLPCAAMRVRTRRHAPEALPQF